MKMFNRKFVKFVDGQYGIRTHWYFGWYFLDLKYPEFQRTRNDLHFSSCKGSADQAYKYFKKRSYNKYRILEGE